MASIFDNYENLSSQYIPSNMKGKNKVPNNNPFLAPIGPKRPYEERNAEGELIGYWWTYGDTVDLDFELSGIATIDDSDEYIGVQDFIKDKQIKIELFNFRHEKINTVIYEGNDFVEELYIETDVDSNTEGVFYIHKYNKYKAVTLPRDYVESETYYRKECGQSPVHIVYPIDLTLSQELVKGTYYCSLSIIGKSISATVFYQDSCTLVVK